MSLAEILPAVRMLPREEKVELVRVLTAELEAPTKSETEEEMLRRLFPPGAVYEIFTPQFPPEAAAELALFLKSVGNESK
jgi:hypothetical protein